jgi:hypothetical protein
MSKDLKAYMVGLAIDPGQLSDFILDSEKAMERAGLSPGDREVLLSGDQGRIFAALAGVTEIKAKENEGISSGDLPAPSSAQPNWASPGATAWQPNVHPMPAWPSPAASWWLWAYPWTQGRK